MCDWISLNSEDFTTYEKLQEHGVEINVGLSPYGFPDAVRGIRDTETGQFVIEFRYLDDDNGEEAQELTSAGDHVRFVVGKHTHRLYEIRIDAEGLGVETVKLNVSIEKRAENAIKQLTLAADSPDRKLHYEVANDVVSRNAEKLLAGV